MAGRRDFGFLPATPIRGGSSMPRYFFNVHDGNDLPDAEGVELAGREEAHCEAILAAGEMLREIDRDFLASDVWEMHVTDASGATVCRLKFSAEDCD